MKNRFRRRSLFGGLSPVRAVGLLALMGFALFVSFRIFRAPTETVQVLAAPDGSREARLQRVYYSSEPGFKVAVRRSGPWQTLAYLPEYTNAPAAELNETLHWSDDSSRLVLELDGKPVWQHLFN
jgi:hypothetical protein